MDAGKEDDPTILHSGIGGDGDRENGLCVTNDETGFSWQTCSDYSEWRTVDSAEDGDDADNAEGDDDETTDEADSGDEADGITYTNYDDDIFLSAHYIDYGGAYDLFEPGDNEDPDWSPRDPEFENDELESDEFNQDDLVAESVEEQCFWSQANCRANEDAPFCCLKRKKSTTVLLPTAAEIGDAMYRSKNIKEWQGYLNEWYNKVQALFGADYYAHMSKLSAIYPFLFYA